MANLQEMANQVRIALRNLKITIKEATDAGLTVTLEPGIKEYINFNTAYFDVSDAVTITMEL